MELRSVAVAVAVVFVCCFISLCRAQRHINEIKYATWNIEKTAWTVVLDRFNGLGVDVLTLQETGQTPKPCANFPTLQTLCTNLNNPIRSTVPSHGCICEVDCLPSPHFIGHQPGDNDLFSNILSFKWIFQTTVLYLYIHDRETREENPPGGRPPRTGENMAIITKKPASDLFYMMPIDKNGVFLPITDPGARVQRPLIGARIENAVFFMYVEPNQTKIMKRQQ